MIDLPLTTYLLRMAAETLLLIVYILILVALSMIPYKIMLLLG